MDRERRDVTRLSNLGIFAHDYCCHKEVSFYIGRGRWNYLPNSLDFISSQLLHFIHVFLAVPNYHNFPRLRLSRSDILQYMLPC